MVMFGQYIIFLILSETTNLLVLYRYLQCDFFCMSNPSTYHMISLFIKMGGFGYIIRFSFLERSNLKILNTYFFL